MHSAARNSVTTLVVALALAVPSVRLLAQTTNAADACDRTTSPWCAGDLLVGAGLTFDSLFVSRTQPNECPDGPGIYDPTAPKANPFYTDSSGQSWYDCAARQNPGIYLQYDRDGRPVAGANGTPARILDGLASGLALTDAQTGAAASVQSWNILASRNSKSKSMVSGEQPWWTTGCAQSPVNGMFVTTGFWSNVISTIGLNSSLASKAIDLGTLTRVNNGVGGGYAGYQVGGAESVVFDKRGNFYVGTVDGNNNILEFDSTGTFVKAFTVPTASTVPAPPSGEQGEAVRGADWLDLAVDDVTMFYTSEGNSVMVFRLDGQPLPQALFDAGVQLVTDSTLDPNGAKRLFGKIVLQRETSPGVYTPIANNVYALRLLPPGDGTGGLLAAIDFDIWRVDLAGHLVREYLPGELTGHHSFAINVTPDGQYFWTATLPVTVEDGIFANDPVSTPSEVMKYHIASGAQIVAPFSPAGGSAYGLCVVNEYTAGATQPDCGADPTNALCTPIPTTCTVGSTNPACVPKETPTISIASKYRQTWTEGDPVSIPIQATDSTGSALTFTASWLPGGVSLAPTLVNPTNNTATTNLYGQLNYFSQTTSGPVQALVTVTNGRGLSASTTYTWDIAYRNGPPVVTAVLPSATISTPHGVPLNSSLSLGQPLTIQSSDPNSCDPPRPALVTTLVGLNSPVETASASCADALTTVYTTTISGTPNTTASQLPGGVFPAGGLRVPATINLIDGAGNTTPVVLDWTLTNDAPSLTIPANQTLHAGAIVPANLNASATDLNNDPVTLTVATTPALPAGTISTSAVATQSGATTVQFTGVAPPPSATNYTTTVTADDGVGGTTISSFTWTVTNTAPTIRNPGAKFSQPGTPIATFNLIADDVDGDPLTFSATGLPPGISVTPTGLVTGIPTTDGIYTVAASVTDGWATASTTFVWRVRERRPPE